MSVSKNEISYKMNEKSMFFYMRSLRAIDHHPKLLDSPGLVEISYALEKWTNDFLYSIQDMLRSDMGRYL